MTRNLLTFWFDTFETAMDASWTVQRRMTLLSAAAARGELLAEPEFWRMGPEKVSAAAEGMMAASVALATQWPRLALTPAALSTAGLAVVAEAAKPARRACRANARRLRRGAR